MKTPVVALVLLFAMADIGWADPPSWDELVAQLGDRTWARREAAHAALLAAGPPAHAALLAHRDHEDPEVRSRLGRIIDALGIISPSDMAALDAAMVRLLHGPAEERANAIRVAMTLGPTGRRVLAETLVAPIGSVVGVANGPAWIEQHGAWSGEIVVTNTSGRTILLPTDELDDASMSIETLIAVRPGCGHSRRSRPVGAPRRPSQHCALERARRIPAGGSIKLEIDGAIGRAIGEKPGGVRLLWRVPLVQTVVVDDVPHELGVADRYPAYGHDTRYPLFIRCPVVVLPPAGPTAVQGVTLSIDPSPAGATDRGVMATLVLTNTGTRPARIDADWPHYTWVALASADGSAVVCRPASSFGRPPPDLRKRTPLDLSAGCSVRYEVAIPTPVAEGRCWLVAAYWNLELDDRTDEPVAPDAGCDSAGYIQGRVLAPRREILCPAYVRPARDPLPYPEPARDCYRAIETEIVGLRDLGYHHEFAMAARLRAMGPPATPLLINALLRLNHALDSDLHLAWRLCHMLEERHPAVRVPCYVFRPSPPPSGYYEASPEAAADRWAAVEQWVELCRAGALR